MPALPSGVRGAVITGWGTSLPPKILTNHDLEQMMDTSHEWIVERSGIHQRHVGAMVAEGLDRLTAVRRFSDQGHVRLTLDHGRDAFAQQWMIVHGEYANR